MPKPYVPISELMQEAVYAMRNREQLTKSCLDDMTAICQVVAHLHATLKDASISHVVIRREAIAACEYLEWILEGRPEVKEAIEEKKAV